MTVTEYTSRLLPPTFSMALSPTEGPVRKFSSSVVPCLLVAAVLFPLAGCIAHAPGSGGGQQQIQVKVTSSPASPASVPVTTPTAASTVQYTATVTGSSNPVTWSLAADPSASTVCTATGTGLGTITNTGANAMTYTAPSTLPVSPCGVVVTATASDNVTTAQALVNVHVVVVVSPQNSTVTQAPETIGQGANLQYTATVIGAPSTAAGQAVNWSAAGAGSFDNPLNNNGLYIAQPLTGGTTSVPATITATSQFDSTQTGTASITVQETDPLGKVSNVQTLSASQCPADSNGGLNNGICYSMTVSCDGVADLTTYLKVNPALGTTPKGTVLFLTGKGGSGLYDNGTWAFGYQTVEAVNATYNTVQVSFGAPFVTAQPNGWLQGPGGVRRLACRYATVSDWVYNNPSKINSTSTASNSAPMCATGNSGGSAAVAYAVYEYGLAGINTTGPSQELVMVEPSSGPPMTRLDLACVCNNSVMGKADNCVGSAPAPMCYSPSEAGIVDTAYQASGQTSPTLCTDGLSGVDASQAIRFASESINYQPTKSPAIPVSKTLSVIMRFGGLDTTTAVPQGETWWTAVGPTPPQPLCSQNSTHEIPDDSVGANDIANDIIGACH
jgi:hypothetical protein